MKNTVSMALAVGAAMTIASATLAIGPARAVTRADLTNLNGTASTSTSTENPFGSYDIVMGLGSFAIGFAANRDSTDFTNDLNVNYDGIAETLQKTITGFAPTVNESVTLIGNIRQRLDIVMTGAGDLFPGGFTVGGAPATDGAVFVGAFGNVIDINAAQTNVLSASIDFFTGASVLQSSHDVTGLLSGKWDGFIGIAFGAITGLGINEVHISVTLNKLATPTPGALALFGIAGLATLRRRR